MSSFKKKTIPADQQALLKKIRSSLKPFKKLRDNMPLQYVRTFLLVAGGEGLNVSTYATRAGTSQALMTRHIQDLGETNRYHEEGLGLLEVYDDPKDRRNRLIRLSVNGKALVDEMCEAFK
jgi:DNA-binding MarR family transcriptional regulator